MYTRFLKPPATSFFLFGPRGTGKSTWVQAAFPMAERFDFLKNDVLLRYLGEPHRLRREIEEKKPGTWVVLDEVQKVPSLLDEVHAVMADRGGEIRFCLTGSSARKLKSKNANLLGGRAIQRHFSPFLSVELGTDFDLEKALRYGTLPLVWTQPDHAVDTLEAYVGTYLREEIQQEAMVRNLETFSRFLKVAALMNGQVVNIAGVSRDVGVPRVSVDRYFSVLADTWIGHWLPGWMPRAKVREKQSPKFYFFDTGVVRAILGRLRDPLDSTERGVLFETFVVNEVRAAQSWLNVGGELFYYRTPAGREVDLIWARGKKSWALEIKSSMDWKSEFTRGAAALVKDKTVQTAFGVYRGNRSFTDSGVHIFSFPDFSRRLFAGKLFV